MKEAYAITGYVSSETAKQLRAKTPGRIDVAAERGVQDFLTQVDGADVTEVRTGSDSGGQTLVQLILRDDAPVHTVFQSTASAKGLQALHDPVLGLIRPPSIIKRIVV
ncbi:MAG: hypothetical protein JO182_18210 [Acidobacteriaceae bacterium]|nr:hypothetical protein [Acidobacteriaceae bacterium]MBV9222740.1 hypothetical protein [Acidobacteriaceae bacterium]MBV9305598.1 hypothetical protein [Acidobacteriaceae bacterium]MBV9678179.1 hypothetical protein [Acidobacteriaceae bacterium]MBV9939518.1 hypothetical protein [Acidobacteriaceae bacterium]